MFSITSNYACKWKTLEEKSQSEFEYELTDEQEIDPICKEMGNTLFPVDTGRR